MTTPTDMQRLTALLRRVADQLEANGIAACHIARDHASPLRSTGSGTAPEGRGKGGHSDPTSNAAGSRDPSRHWAAELDRRTKRIGEEAAGLGQLIHDLTSRTPRPERTPGAGAGTCLACQRWVTGGATDRLRSGFCEKDYRRYLADGRPDRAVWVRGRPVVSAP